jgi:hypothetical protein
VVAACGRGNRVAHAAHADWSGAIGRAAVANLTVAVPTPGLQDVRRRLGLGAWDPCNQHGSKQANADRETPTASMYLHSQSLPRLPDLG